MRDVEKGRRNDLIVLEDTPLNIPLSRDVVRSLDPMIFEEVYECAASGVELSKPHFQFRSRQVVTSIDGRVEG